MADEKKPRIRLNSAKVSQLPEAGDNLVDISENSRFAQWRQAQEEERQSGQSEPQSLPSAPVQLRPKRRAAGSWKKWAYGVGALVLATLIFVGVVFFSPLLATRTITVEGASLLDEATVQQQLSQLQLFLLQW